MEGITGLLEKYKKIGGERFFAELFTNNEYLLARKVKADVVVDVGACAGEFSAYIYEQAGIIYSIEPYSEHYKELEANIQEFNLTKIKPFNLALFSENGERKLAIGARGSHRLATEGTEVVKTKTIKTFLEENNIDHVDILKIDIEGGENEVFNIDFAKIAGKFSFIIGEHLAGTPEQNLLNCGFRKIQDGSNQIFIK